MDGLLYDQSHLMRIKGRSLTSMFYNHYRLRIRYLLTTMFKKMYGFSVLFNCLLQLLLASSVLVLAYPVLELPHNTGNTAHQNSVIRKYIPFKVSPCTPRQNHEMSEGWHEAARMAEYAAYRVLSDRSGASVFTVPRPSPQPFTKAVDMETV
jgi:hypothetical protein